MNIDGTCGFFVGVGVTLLVVFISAMLYCRRNNSNGAMFNGVTGRIAIYERYDAKDLASKKAAVDTCIKLLEDNGYVMSYMDTEIHSNHFIVVVGCRKEK